jgi:hypothetical protein
LPRDHLHYRLGAFALFLFVRGPASPNFSNIFGLRLKVVIKDCLAPIQSNYFRYFFALSDDPNRLCVMECCLGATAAARILIALPHDFNGAASHSVNRSTQASARDERLRALIAAISSPHQSLGGSPCGFGP